MPPPAAGAMPGSSRAPRSPGPAHAGTTGFSWDSRGCWQASEAAPAPPAPSPSSRCRKWHSRAITAWRTAELQGRQMEKGGALPACCCLPLPNFSPCPNLPLPSLPAARSEASLPEQASGHTQQVVGACQPSPGTSNAAYCTGVAKTRGAALQEEDGDPPPNPSIAPRTPPAPLCSHQGRSLRHHHGQTSPPPPSKGPLRTPRLCAPPPQAPLRPEQLVTPVARPRTSRPGAEHRLPQAGSGPTPGPNSEKYSGASNGSRCLRENFQPPSFSFYRAEERLPLR